MSTSGAFTDQVCLNVIQSLDPKGLKLQQAKHVTSDRLLYHSFGQSHASHCINLLWVLHHNKCLRNVSQRSGPSTLSPRDANIGICQQDNSLNAVLGNNSSVIEPRTITITALSEGLRARTSTLHTYSCRIMTLASANAQITAVVCNPIDIKTRLYAIIVSRRALVQFRDQKRHILGFPGCLFVPE